MNLEKTLSEDVKNFSDYDKKLLQSKNSADVMRVVKEYDKDNALNLDNTALDVLNKWVLQYKTFDINKNPMTRFLNHLKKLNITPNGQSLITINNLIAQNQLSTKDLGNNEHKIINKADFYKQDYESQEFLVSVYNSLKDDRIVERIKKSLLLNSKDDRVKFETFGENPIKADSITSDFLIKNLLFKDGIEKEFRAADDIESDLNKITNMEQKGISQGKLDKPEETTKQKKTGYYNRSKAKQNFDRVKKDILNNDKYDYSDFLTYIENEVL